MKVKSESEVAQCVQLLATPWAAAYQAPPSMGFSRQEYWSGVPLPSPMMREGELQLWELEPGAYGAGKVSPGEGQTKPSAGAD